MSCDCRFTPCVRNQSQFPFSFLRFSFSPFLPFLSCILHFPHASPCLWGSTVTQNFVPLVILLWSMAFPLTPIDYCLIEPSPRPGASHLMSYRAFNSTRRPWLVMPSHIFLSSSSSIRAVKRCDFPHPSRVSAQTGCAAFSEIARPM